ncbi:MAG: VCBS repeat-containing protein [Planctomycetes bacterium]|nr:VCBS repeat-containing protein [Planctomycetota bacterium]
MYKIFLSLSIFIIAGCSYLEFAKEEVKNGDEMANLREHQRALMHYQSALESKPRDSEIKLKIAWLYRRIEKNEDAINWFNAIIAQHPDCYEAYYGLWNTMLAVAEDDASKENRKKQVKAKLESLLKTDSPGDKLYSMAFMVFMELEDYPKADEMKKLLISSYPKSKELDDVGQESFERILGVSPELSKRAPLCEIFVKEFPHHKMTGTAYRIALTYYWRDVKIKTKVESLCRQWIASCPQDPMAFYMSSRVHAEMDIDLPQAMEWAEECVRLIKNDKTPKPSWYDEWQYKDAVMLYQAYDALGWVYYKSGDYAKAEQVLKRGLESNDFNDVLWYHLGRVYQATGRLSDALNAMARSLMCRGDMPEVHEALKEILPKMMTQATELTGDELTGNFYQAFASGYDTAYFVDISEKSGLAKSGGRRVAWGDFDNDGFQDLLVDGGDLWRNKGDGTFEDVAAKAGINMACGGGAWADIDNDGWLDFFSSGWPDVAWKNNGDGTFKNITADLEIANDNALTEGAAWGDYNRDGFVDIYMANYEKPGKQLSMGTPDRLLENVRGKWFRDVTLDAGTVSLEPMCGRGVVWGDYNNDGFPDIFVANYRLDPDFLWKNNGNGTFTNVARETGAEGVAGKYGYFGHGIGADFGDFNNDGNLDLFVGNLAHPRYMEFSNMSYLLKNSGAPDYKFSDFRQPLGIRYEETHSNPAWCDYDNDGLLDLYITCVYEGLTSFLYKQGKNGRFIDATWITGTRLMDGWGCAWADFDNDGDMDLAVSGKEIVLDKEKDKKGYRIFLFRNETKQLLPERHWLEVKLVGKDCNRSAIGARVTISNGKAKYTREVQGGTGTTCQSSLVQHFGLGEGVDTVSVSVRWPCGKVEELTTAVDHIITVEEK